MYTLCNPDLPWAERTAIMLEPYKQIKDIYNEAIGEEAELNVLLEKARHYEERKAEGQLLAKIGFGRPKHSSDDVLEAKKDLANTLFLDIVKLAKEHRSHLVYLEFESPETHINDEDYRHYALSYAKNAIDRLPMIMRLPEKRDVFEMATLQESLESTKRYEM